MTLVVLGGRYRLLNPLGSGGMAEVWEALDESLGRRVAVKLLHARALPPERERFFLEVKALSRLSHPGVVQVLDLGEWEGRPYFVMELVEGGSFDSLGPFEESEEGERILEAAAQVMEALAHLHRAGILHRDLTPKNILLTKEGQPKVMDFGLAYLLQESQRLTRTGFTLGTPLYMAPEQAKGLPLTPKADLYSLGAVLYRTLTGRPPFEGENDQAILFQHVYEPPKPPEALNPAVPKEVGEVVLALLAKHPDERPKEAGILRQANQSLRNLRYGVARGGASRTGQYPEGPFLPRKLTLKGRLELGLEVAWPLEMIHTEGKLFIGAGRSLIQVDLMGWELDPQTALRRLELPEEVSAPPVYRPGQGVFLGSRDGRLRHYRGGRVVWSFRTNDEISGSPLVLGERVYLPSRDGGLYALDTSLSIASEEERLLWRFQAGGHLSASPTFHRGLLLLGGEDGWLYALDPGKGRLLYKVKTGPIHAPVAGYGGVVYIPTWPGEVYAFRLSDRETLWSYDLEGEIWGGVAVDKHRLYAAGWNGVVYALDRLTGEEIWSLEVGKVTAGLSLAQGHLYIATEEGRLLAVEVEGGQVVFEAEGLGAIQVPPLPLGSEVFVINVQGRLYRFGLG
ncbi:MAG: serine/threonine-protein kinase [Thermaceae bacterium]